MPESQFRIAKRRLPVRLYLFNGDEVRGIIFLHHSRNEYGLPEEPSDLLNRRSPFIAIADESNVINFYNKSMVLYLTYQESQDSMVATETNLKQKIVVSLHGGLRLSGKVQALLPPEKARLYDFLNLDDETFIKMLGIDKTVCLINKAFITVVNQA